LRKSDPVASTMPAGDVAKVDAYLRKLPDAQRKALDKLRGQIRAAAPKAEEGFGYGLPGFYLQGPLFYYGAAKDHCAHRRTICHGAWENACLSQFRHPCRGDVRHDGPEARWDPCSQSVPHCISGPALAV
ncbi:MAG: hypothetical protein LC620_02305, partial [Halobacteriales archaeon]|nr:hypothetical protein [Halobacteriales archaeon]